MTTSRCSFPLRLLALCFVLLLWSPISLSLPSTTTGYVSRRSRQKRSSSATSNYGSHRSTTKGTGGAEGLQDSLSETALGENSGAGLRRRKRRGARAATFEPSLRSSLSTERGGSGYTKRSGRGESFDSLAAGTELDTSGWDGKSRAASTTSRTTGNKGTAEDEIDSLIDELSSTSAGLSLKVGVKSRNKRTDGEVSRKFHQKSTFSDADGSGAKESSLTYKVRQPSTESHTGFDQGRSKNMQSFVEEDEMADLSKEKTSNGLVSSALKDDSGSKGQSASSAGKSTGSSIDTTSETEEEDGQGSTSTVDDGLIRSVRKTIPASKKKLFFPEDSFTDVSSQGSSAALPELTSEQSPKSKNAYALILYTGTRRDFEYFIGLRVTLQTLKWTRTSADLVVLASPNVPSTWKNILLDDGARVVLTPNVGNPYNTTGVYNPRFRFVLNKLMAWRLTEYTRVVLLDSDNLVLKNMDELFLCGDFCAVFINPCIFHTGLITLKPSNKKFRKMIRSLTQLPSFDGADQGFLQSFFPGLLASPLFERPPNKTLSKNALRPLRGLYRLPMGYQMDAIYFSLKNKWEVPCSENKVITFPGVSALKPWYWWSWPLFPLSMQWHMTRLASIGYPWEFSICLGFGILWGILLVSTYLKALMGCLCPGRREKGGAPDSPKRSNICCGIRIPSFALLFPRLFNALRQAGSFVWTMLTLASIPSAFLLSYSVIPATTHPLVGWPLFLLGVFAMLKSVRTITGAPTAIYWLPAYIVLLLLVLALPIYRSLAFRLVIFHILAFGGGLVTMLVYQSVSSYGWGRNNKGQEGDRSRAE